MRELPSPSPSPLPFSSPPHATIDLSPPLIAMVVVVGTAFLIVLYTRVISQLFRRLHRRFRRWRRRRRLLLFSAPSPMTRHHHDPTGTNTTISFGSSSDYFIFSPYGLDDSSIKALPTSFFSKSKAKHLACTNRDCAVCLLEFEDNDYIRTLPYCSHAFHVECIDVWLRSHATCPLCRASVIRPELNYSYSPFVPMRASRIRPSLDDFFLCPPIHLQRESISELEPEIEIEIVPGNATSISPPTSYSSNRRDRSNLMLKRSYSFGFERNLANERMVLEPSTASPWRFRQHHRNSNSFWSKRWPSPSPFQGSASASRSSRVFSFRSYRAIKSPFNRRRTDSSIRLGHGPGLSARRARSMTMGFYSSRMRCGDPEALLSPERLNNR